MKVAGMLVIASMLGTACTAVNPEELDPEEENNNNESNEDNPKLSEYEYPIPEAIDLGLSVKWADINLFSSEPFSIGGHVSWGEMYGNGFYDWSHYKLCKRSKYALTRYNSDKDYGKVDNKTDFKDYNYKDDAARAYLGGKWRIPTNDEWTELEENCNWKWEYKYIKDPANPNKNLKLGGYRITGKKEGYTDASIFLPATGYFNEKGENDFRGSIGAYWSSTAGSCATAMSAHFYGLEKAKRQYSSRCQGLSIRPVTD